MIIFIKKLFNIALTKQEKEAEMVRLTAKYEQYKEARRVLAKDIKTL
jgi:hypothetical protein